MKITATTGRSTSTDYIKVRLFDWLADGFLEIDGEPAYEVVDRIKALAPYFDVDDVITYALDQGETITSALEVAENSL